MQIPSLASNFMIKLFKECNQMLTDVLHSIRFWCLYFLIKLLYVRWKCRKYFCKLYPYHQHQHQPYTDRTDWLTDNIQWLYSLLLLFLQHIYYFVWWQRLNWVKWKMLISLFYFIFMKYSFHHQKKNERVKCLWKMRWKNFI